MTISFIRTLIIYVIMVIVIRVMGKRQMGDLEPIELVVIIMISDLATVPMQNIETPLMGGIVPVLALVSFEILLSAIALKCRAFRKLALGVSSIIIENGKMNQKEMRRMRLSVAELIEELRINGYPNPSQVRYAILETNGNVSIIPYAQHDTVHRSDMSIKANDDTLPFTIISDGKIVESELKKSGLKRERIKELVTQQGFSKIKDVFLMQIDECGKLFFLAKEKSA